MQEVQVDPCQRLAGAIQLACCEHAAPRVQVGRALAAAATRGSFQGAGMRPGTPNLLLCSQLYGGSPSGEGPVVATAAAGPVPEVPADG